jgi:plasmid stabilization system protein ParE
MKAVDYLPGARCDYDESFDWYGERSTLAAERFSNAVDAALNRIVADPEQFARIDSIHRECPVRRFPFRIVYRIEPTRILIVALAHAKRRPGYWRHRG